jgi:rare lipoprotein A
MRAFRYRRHVVVATLAAGATAILIGCQQLVSTPAPAPVAADSTLSFKALEVQKTTFIGAALMPAAVPTGEYEKLVPFVPPVAVEPAPKPAAEPKEEPKSEAKSEAKAEAKSEAKAEAEPEQEAASVNTRMLVYESGIASTYGLGDGFEGERTGCGQIFRTQVVQVAHKTLPCGTIIRIEDTDTGKTVDAEVTDRGPYVAGRIVDLSHAAFTQLDPVGTGLLNVNVYILDTSNQYLYRLR